jgi:hypothetical protein
MYIEVQLSTFQYIQEHRFSGLVQSRVPYELENWVPFKQRRIRHMFLGCKKTETLINHSGKR